VTSELFAVLATFAVSLVPMLELRAGIPLGMALGLPAAIATAVAVLGNVLQVHFAIVAAAFAYRRSSRIPQLARWLGKTEQQISRHSALIGRWGWLGLAAFVLLPLPGTGVWGAVVLSRLLGMHTNGVWMGISLGVALSGLLFGLAAHGMVNLVRFLW